MDIRSTLTELCDAFNAHDLDRIIALFSEDCVLEMPTGGEPWGTRFEGKLGVRDALAIRFAGLPDIHYGDAEHFVDTTADAGMSKWTLTGTTPDGVRKKVRGLGRPAAAPGGVRRVSAETSPLAGALALAFAHGPLAGIAPALIAEREGSTFSVRAYWSLSDGSVSIQARGTTVDVCHDKVARQVLRLWPELEEAAEWL